MTAFMALGRLKSIEEEPMELGRLHDARSAPLSICSQERGAYLQLVESVCAPRQSHGAPRGNHESRLSALRHRAKEPACWPDTPITSLHAARELANSCFTTLHAVLGAIARDR